MDSRPSRNEWFPMRVTYNRELKVKEQLDSLHVENYLPMQYEVKGEGGNQQLALLPAIHNLIFIRSTQEAITLMKTTIRSLEPLRYMMRPVEGKEGAREIIRVPDRQMEHFMRVASVGDERVMFLSYDNYIDKVGRRVRVTQGFFAGVEGVIKRIKNNRRVVVRIDGVAAVAIANVPAEYIQEIE